MRFAILALGPFSLLAAPLAEAQPARMLRTANDNQAGGERQGYDSTDSAATRGRGDPVMARCALVAVSTLLPVVVD